MRRTALLSVLVFFWGRFLLQPLPSSAVSYRHPSLSAPSHPSVHRRREDFLSFFHDTNDSKDISPLIRSPVFLFSFPSPSRYHIDDTFRPTRSVRTSQDIPAHWRKKNFFFNTHGRRRVCPFFLFYFSLSIIRAWLLLHHPRRSIPQIYREATRTGGQAGRVSNPPTTRINALPASAYILYLLTHYLHTPPSRHASPLTAGAQQNHNEPRPFPPPLDHGVSFRQEEGGAWSPRRSTRWPRNHTRSRRRRQRWWWWCLEHDS